MKKMICALLLCSLLIFNASAEVLPVFDFEYDNASAMLNSGNVVVNATHMSYELTGTNAQKGKGLKLTFLETGDGAFQGLTFNLPIFSRDLSLHEGLRFYMSVPPLTSYPRYVEMKVQFDMPSRAQIISGQTFYTTDANGVTTEQQVRDGNVLRLNSGFKGWVYIPFFAFQSTSSSAQIRKDQFMRMYMLVDCDYYAGRSVTLDSVGFYMIKDLPHVSITTIPLMTNPTSADTEETEPAYSEPNEDYTDVTTEYTETTTEETTEQTIAETTETMDSTTSASSPAVTTPKKSSGLIFWIIGGVVLVAGGGVALLWFLKQKKEKAQPQGLPKD